MSDTQFKAFIRFLLDALRDACAEADESVRMSKLERILDNLQTSLED